MFWIRCSLSCSDGLIFPSEASWAILRSQLRGHRDVVASEKQVLPPWVQPEFVKPLVSSFRLLKCGAVAGKSCRLRWVWSGLCEAATVHVSVLSRVPSTTEALLAISRHLEQEMK